MAENISRMNLMNPIRRTLLGAALVAASLVALGNTATQPVPRDAAVAPAESRWMKRHKGFVAIARQGGIGVLFLGDSITDFWRDEDYWSAKLGGGGGKEVWDANFATLHPANFGISADRTQHLLWRMQNGELDGIDPKVIVLLIGTNNLGFEKNSTVPRNTTAEAIEGVTAVVQYVRLKLPHSRILLLGIFPRGAKDDPIRGQVTAVNTAIARLDDGTHVRFLDFGAAYLKPDGSIDTTTMPDLLHPDRKGYEIWAAAIREPLAELLK
jgi:lysophospholipase L1-like esterase